MKTVHVAAGVICRPNTNEVLAVQRGYGKMAGLWEFPGGKVENGETAEAACQRELAEELQVHVHRLRSCYTVEHDYKDFHLSMECFFCEIEPGEDGTVPDPARNDRQQDMRWVSRNELLDLEWMPADVEFVGLLAAGTTDEDGAVGTAGGAAAASCPAKGARQDGSKGTALAPGDLPAEDAGSDPDSSATATAAKDGGELDSPATKKAASKPKAKAKAKKRRRAKAKPKNLMEQLDVEGLSAEAAEMVRKREAVRRSMKGNVRANTKPEVLVRQRLREAGLTGYRLQWKKAPGRPDIAFVGRRVAIFVNGCFWHRCPHCNPSMPKRNVEFWETKFARNQERDQRAQRELAEAGWLPIVIWECELKRDRIDKTMATVIDQVRARG